ncbi:MAG: serine--tRNA ligase [Alphaproteobacteria bacterium]|nr:serine--tRNA ligase [Alphaproteobacteria bacterium]MCY4229523.1 serine--tRNA ligase [Alphaproteobacteria bacterium]MCY4319536.1 serine--tRNA ligase [Alphaproteobacteria bacterium]
MLDLRWIRESPEALDRALVRRGEAPAAAQLGALDAERRACQTRFQECRQHRNALSREIGKAKATGGSADDLIAEVSRLKDEERAAEEAERKAAAALDALLEGLPNPPDEDVPDGAGEADNVELGQTGTPPRFGFAPKDHVELGEALGLMDFERAAILSGARFVVLRGALARLERALAQFMLDTHTEEFGYEEVSPPTLVRGRALFGTGQLPKFEQDLFGTNTGHWLIPTAEVPLTNLAAGRILAEEELPLRFTAFTPCYRSEAGSAGRDTRGMIRQHQFQKVELVSVTHPEASTEEHERMTQAAETILQRLELPYRRMLLCTGDLGAVARKTYDLEVWLPGQDAYREISSCSNCGDYQARRMNARFRPSGSKATYFVHTLNGSGLAVGRTLVALLENGQQSDGSIALPSAIRPYMGGCQRLE